MSAPEGLRGELEQQGSTELPVTVDDGRAAGALPRHHDDPFDRVLIARAGRRGLPLLSVDDAPPTTTSDSGDPSDSHDRWTTARPAA